VSQFDIDDPEEFLRQWDAALHPEIDGAPVLRYAQIEPATPIGHVQVEGVPDDVLEEYYEDEPDEELEELAARYGGTVTRTETQPASLAMVRLPDGGYRVYELDDAGTPTGHSIDYKSVDDPLRSSALGYGSPLGTLCWREVPANR
jgi:hypothetical protein